MIIRFSVENWRSFKEPATLDMVAGSEKQHADRLPRVKKFCLKILPVAAIYGANASGKTKFVEALAFLQNLIVLGNNKNVRFGLQRFKLDKDCLQRPVNFSLTALIDEVIYRYELSLLPEKVVHEKLTLENSSSIYELFTRKDDGTVIFDKDYFEEDRLAFLNFVASATRENQLLLSNAIDLNVNEFNLFYDWIKDNLVILNTESVFTAIHRFADPSDKISEQLLEFLQRFGTGIDRFETQKTTFQNSSLVNIPAPLISEIKSKLQETEGKLRIGDSVLSLDGDELVIERLVAVHKSKNGDPLIFSLQDESDGTVRLLDLIPAVVKPGNNKNLVVIVDEMDRSLHTKVLEELVRFFLNKCNQDSRGQLIFTTHDVNIMTQETFRRDELWLVNKYQNGESSLYSLGEFKGVRKDKDIRKIYLEGAFGAIPGTL